MYNIIINSSLKKNLEIIVIKIYIDIINHCYMNKSSIKILNVDSVAEINHAT